MSLSLTVVLPAHNEGGGIKKTLLELDSFAPKNMNLTIFVSEDGSSDNTRSEVDSAATLVLNSEISLAPIAGRLGYSRAVIRGIENCETELIAFMDGDGQCDPSNLSTLLSHATPGTVVVGYRNPRNDSAARIAYSKAFGVAYRLFGGPKRIDPSSPFIVCYRKDIEFLISTTPKLSFGFWWEFQTRVSKRGLKVIEIPINHRNRLAGQTQVYSLKKIPRIVTTHLLGLYKLNRELKNT
jgi:dolichol-phosphate mannosyltransferase